MKKSAIVRRSAGGQRAGAGEVVDVVAVAGVGRDPARRRVGLGDVAVALEHRHLVADGRGRDAEPGGLRDRLRPTGCALSTYCSTIARRIAALRSSSSVMQPGPVSGRHGKRSLPVGTRWYRVPTAPATQEPGGDVGRRAAGRERVSTTRSPTRCTNPGSAELVDHGAAAASATGAPARVRSASANASSARGAGSRRSAPASAGRAGARPRRCSARACARSTSAGRRCGRARRSRCRGTRPRSSREGCGGTPRRAGPSSRPRTTRARPRRAASSASEVRVGLVVVVGRGRAGRDAPAERRRRLDGQRVRAHVLDVERERAVERRAPVVERLARRAVDEVDVDALEARVARRARSRARRWRDRACGPSAASTCGAIDCTPKLSRFTPAARYARELRRRRRCRDCTRP